MAKRKTHKTFVKEVKELFGNKFTVVGKYINNRTKIEIKHNECGKTWMANASFLLRGHGCPYCQINSKKTNKQFREDLYKAVKDEYIALDKYENNKTKVRMKHLKCGHIWKVTPAHFLSKTSPTRCPICQRNIIDLNRRKTQKMFNDEIKSLVGKEYTFLDIYEGTDTNIRVKHNVCGNVYKVRPSAFILGNRCPKCNRSKGEQLIKIYLNKHNIKYKEQYSFMDCRGERKPLLFDFALFDKDNLIGLIEFDGKQHFEAIDFYGGQEQFEIRKRYDEVKDDYCKRNNITLTRIPYWDIDNIDDYIDNKLEEWNKPLQLSVL